MNKVIIINGPSCAGKTTIAKEICKQSGNKFAHLQIDKTAEYSGTIFPQGFEFAKNEVGTESNDDGQSLFNNNRFARRKVVASILLASSKELLNQGISVVIDTALDGPDAKELAKYYLEYLKNYDTKFIGIYCPLEERLKRLKTRTDNLHLTEDFVRQQTEVYNVFELNKDVYDNWFDSSKLNAEQIAAKILNDDIILEIDKFTVRSSIKSDVESLVKLSRAKRLDYEKVQPIFWRYAGESGDKAQKEWFADLLEMQDYLIFTAESKDKEIIGFIIGRLMSAPEVYNPGGLTLMIDDFCVKSETLWKTVGRALLEKIKTEAKFKAAVQIVVVCGAHDESKRRFLISQKLNIASEWFVGEV
ncbi:MAG: GNAT family N-acetyltransferase [Sphingobacteriia bacterium]|nr:GNAT family N-acetyltransferase [Sphingobacteriia bacterium]